MAHSLIVCESTGRWAAAWRRALSFAAPEQPYQLTEIRLLGDCAERLEREPAAVIAVELTSRLARELVEWLASLERYRPEALAVVLSDASLGGWEPLVREAGAAAFVPSPRALPPAAEMVRRHWARRDGQMARAAEVTDQIWRTLPWESSARTTRP